VDLWNNGPLSTGPLSKSGVAAPAGTTWSECQNNAGNLTESNSVAGFSAYRNAAGTTDFHLADDFTITDPYGWQIDSMSLFAYRTTQPTTTTPFLEAYARVWSGRPGDVGSTVVFGDMTTNRLTASTFSNMYRIFNSAVPPPGTAPGTTRAIWQNDLSVGTTLGPGTYWVEWTYKMIVDTYTSFTPPVTIVDTRGLPGWNARQYVTPAPPALPYWQDCIDVGNPATAPDVLQDIAFIMRGSVIPEPMTVALLAFGALLLRRRR
jgi:hypothetical protein